MKLSALRTLRIDRTRNNPFARTEAGQPWVLPVTAMSLVLGFMMAAAWVSEGTRNGRSAFLQSDQKQRLPGATDTAELQSVQAEVQKLLAEKTRLENALADKGKGETTLNDSLQEAKVFGGLTPLGGPGVIVTISDNPKAVLSADGTSNSIVHDGDVLRLVNELLASGAEGISVNNIRHAAGTSYRCVGPTILVDGARIASPVVIRAVGDSDALLGGLRLPGGVVADIQGDPNDPPVIKMERAKALRLPAYSGSTVRRVATVPKDEKPSESKAKAEASDDQ